MILRTVLLLIEKLRYDQLVVVSRHIRSIQRDKIIEMMETNARWKQLYPGQ